MRAHLRKKQRSLGISLRACIPHYPFLNINYFLSNILEKLMHPQGNLLVVLLLGRTEKKKKTITV
jgi:hypothetical protein